MFAFVNWLMSLFTEKSSRKRAVRSAYQPRLLVLEDRCVPAVFTWTGAAGGGDFSAANPMNWVDDNMQQGVPTANDDVVYTVNNDVECYFTGFVTVQKLTIEAGHTAAISVADLTIANGGEIFDGGLYGGAVHVQAGGDPLGWRGGTIAVQFYVETNAVMNIGPGGVDKVVTGGAEGGDIHNFGRINWTKGGGNDIIHVSDSATIENHANSRFDLVSVAGTMTIGSQNEVGSLIVAPTAQLNSATAPPDIYINCFFENRVVSP